MNQQSILKLGIVLPIEISCFCCITVNFSLTNKTHLETAIYGEPQF